MPDSDIAEAGGTAYAGPQRLGKGLLGRKTLGKKPGLDVTSLVFPPLHIIEDALGEGIAKTAERLFYAHDLDNIGAYPVNHCSF